MYRTHRAALALALACGCDAPIAPSPDLALDLATPSGDAATRPPYPVLPPELDVGVYWFGPGDRSQRYVPGQQNPYYDPTRPTVLHSHGWQRGAVAKGLNKSFNYKRNEPTYGVDVNAADAWIAAGWNVGLLYWVQLADEDSVTDAEAKIWAATGPKGLRWRRLDGSYQDGGVPAASVDELFGQVLQSALFDYRGPGLRLTGHSLGNQLAMALAQRLVDRGGPRPLRVALLDPFWSNGAKEYLQGQWTGERTRALAATLGAAGVALEQFRTSAINDLWVGDNNLALQQRTAYAELRPDFIPAIDLQSRHIAAAHLYYYNFGFPAPRECVPSGATCPISDAGGPGPKASDARVREVQASAYKHVQAEGLLTIDPSDDVFRREAR